MNIQEIAYLIIWITGSFLIAFYLEKRCSFFKKLLGALSLLASFVLFVILHNAIYGLLQIEESIFFLLALFSIGASAFLLIIQIIKNIIKIGRKQHQR